MVPNTPRNTWAAWASDNISMKLAWVQHYVNSNKNHVAPYGLFLRCTWFCSPCAGGGGEHKSSGTGQVCHLVRLRARGDSETNQVRTSDNTCHARCDAKKAAAEQRNDKVRKKWWIMVPGMFWIYYPRGWEVACNLESRWSKKKKKQWRGWFMRKSYINVPMNLSKVTLVHYNSVWNYCSTAVALSWEGTC